MKAYLSRRYRFSASHRLHVGNLPAEENVRLYGKCNNPYGHGHNYVVEVTYSGQVDRVTGMVLDLAALDQFAQEKVLDPFHLSNLNVLPCFEQQVTSTEYLSMVLHDIFSGFTSAVLEGVRVEETRNNSFEFREGLL